MNVNRLEQTVSKLQKLVIRTNRLAAYNSTFAIGGVSCSVKSFMVTKSLYLRINICGEKPAHRKSAKRYAQCYDDRATDEHFSLISNFCVKLDNLTGQI